MREGPPRTIQSRAIIGMVALYALLLQAFLGTLLPPVPASPSTSAICAHEDLELPLDQACRQHACCIAVQATGLIDPPPAGFAAVIWTERRGAPVAWYPALVASARAPPDFAVSPRGPPAV